MKNRIITFLLIMCMILSVFGMTGCNMMDMLAESDYVYDAEKVQASINNLTASGYKITVRYLVIGTETGSQPEIQSSGFTIAAEGDLWYCEQIENGAKTTVIMDFSDDTDFVTYTKEDGDTMWLKTVNSYENIGSKETVKSLYMDTYIATFTSYGVIGVGLKDKGAVTVAGRACTKYAVSVSAFGASYSNEYCIDNETGLCLKNVMAVGAASEGSASTSYECTAFEVGYRITLPAESECTTEVKDDDGDNGGSSNNTGNGSNTGSTGNVGSATDFDFDTVMGGNSSTDTIWGKQDEEVKQQMIAEGKEAGVEVSFGTDGSMTVVDPTTGDTVIQNPDGTWSIKSEDGTVGQYGGSWPENDFTKMLPKPDMELLIASTTDDSFNVGFKDATLAQVKAYAEKVKATGFTIDAEITDQAVGEMVVYAYTAQNAAGYTVTVAFTSGISSVIIEKP